MPPSMGISSSPTMMTGTAGRDTMRQQHRHQPPATSSSTNSSNRNRYQHNPLLGLSSDCVRLAFGPTVQIVADALARSNSSTLRQIVDSTHLVGAPIRASLLVLMQHDIVSCSLQRSRRTGDRATSSKQCIYHFHALQARNLLRYAKYVEFVKKTTDELTASVAQALLMKGKLQTMDWMVQALQRHADSDDSHGQMIREQVVEAMYVLVREAYVQIVEPMEDEGDDDDTQEHEFEQEPLRKRVRRTNSSDERDTELEADPALLSELTNNAKYKESLPLDAVWRVNRSMLNKFFQAYQLGRLVAERYGQRVQSCGSLVTAALKFVAQTRNRNENQAGDAGFSFEAADAVRHLPKPVYELLERKEGGLQHNLQKAFSDLSRLHSPSVVRVLTTATSSDVVVRYQVDVPSLSRYLQKRATHQLIHDRHGEVAARIISILSSSPVHDDAISCTEPCWMESEPLADAAMMPVKDTREILHSLYKNRYVDLLQLSTRQQYNPASTLYLWGVHRDRLRQSIVENVALALWNIRLRRQHELDVGKEWMERAQREQQQRTDENNDHEVMVDQRNYQRFCLGLERLDFAAMQLDDTLLLMYDYAVE